MKLGALRSASPRSLAGGAALGAVSGFLAAQLGILDITGLGHPTEIVLVAAVVGLVAALFKVEMLIGALDLLMVAVWLFITQTPVIYGRATAWVRDDGPIVQPLDAIIVLSGGVRSDSSIDPEAYQRLMTGVELIKAGRAPRIVTSIVTQKYGGQEVSSEQAERAVIHLAGAEGAWNSVDSVHSTRDEAAQMARLLLPAGARSVAVVTSPMHTRRACATFEMAGFRVHCVPSGEGVAVTWHPLGSSDRLAAFREYSYERLGMVKYRAEGWLPK